MAVETVKSTQITNFNASPAVATTKGEGAPYRPKAVDAKVAVAAGTSIGSKYLLFRVPSNVILKDLLIRHTALGATGQADFGVYYPDDARYTPIASNVGVAIDDDAFSNSQVLEAAVLVPTSIFNKNIWTLATGSAKWFQPLWQAAGLSADPKGFLDIVATMDEAGTDAGVLFAKLEYVE